MKVLDQAGAVHKAVARHLQGDERRHTADERREEILAVASRAFADTGLEGTSTEEIARRVGISQPYLFRLFGTKKQLFLAVVERSFRELMEAFREAVDHGDPAIAVDKRMGDAYVELIRDRSKLRMQMQAYTASEDPEVRALVQPRFGEVFAYIQATTGRDNADVALFIATGMLLNVMASIQAIDSQEPWAVALREGCMKHLP